MKLFLILILAMGSLAHAVFVPPSEGPVPFRRDKLPVDVDTMASLSKQLVVMTGATDLSDPVQARRAAQILGLSLALDPTNRESLNMVRRLRKGNETFSGGSDEINQATSRAWHLMGWLEQPEAGADGNALAACLADILSGVDPEHPRAVELAGKGERGKWDGWVASVDAFKDDRSEKIDDPEMAETEETPDEPSNNDSAVALKLATASVNIPLWYIDKASSKLILRPVAVNMKAWIEGENEKISVKVGDEESTEQDGKIASMLNDFLKSRHGEVPKGLHFRFQLADGIPYSPMRNGNAILGAVVVLADAALSGNASEGIVFAEPDSDGALKLPAKFWQTIRELADSKPGSRLIVPSAAKDFMAPLITLDKSSFFINFEVLMADDVGSLCELASSNPPQEVRDAHDVFETIREAIGTRSLGGFLSHDSTQQRLKQVIGICPLHISARMLALRGTSQWPKRLPRDIFAREIRASIEPIRSEFQKGGWMELKGESLQAKVDTCREELTAVEKLFGSVGDRQELHAPAFNMTKLMSGLASDAKRNGGDENNRNEHEAKYRAAWAEYVRVVQLLTFAAGDSDDYPLPEVKKPN